MVRCMAISLSWLLGFSVAFGLVQAKDPPDGMAEVSAPAEMPSTSSAPAATLGLPQPIPRLRTQPRPPVFVDIRPIGYDDPPITPPATAITRQEDFAVPPPFRPLDAGTTAARSNYGAEPGYEPTAPDRHGLSRSRFGEFLDGGVFDGHWLQRRDGWFRSDHCFDSFISPVTNPLLFEDPRSLTEVRPLFFIQQIPNGNATFRGGNAEYFGAQFRVAFTDRFSLVVNKLGAVSINPGSGSAVPSGFGFAEIHLGPKFTFMRDQENRALGAMGLTFEIPAGRASVFQDTGSLSLVPYVALAKNFLTTRAGSLNVMDTFGYSFATDRQRTNFLFQSFHLDWDVLDRHKFYPLVEINWFYYGRSGTQRSLGTEGRDLANIGSTGVGGKNNLHLALGFRYQFSERFQAGTAIEMPLANRRDLLEYRGTIDFIWRY